MTEGEEGKRIAKLELEERIPQIGDKFCSKQDQKEQLELFYPNVMSALKMAYDQI